MQRCRGAEVQVQEEHLLADVHEGDLVASAGRHLGDPRTHQAPTYHHHLGVRCQVTGIRCMVTCAEWKLFKVFVRFDDLLDGGL